jgi:hypothetical protein
LRNLAPRRRARRNALDEVLIYQPASETTAALEALAEAGVIELTPSDVGLTPRGIAFMERLYGLTSDMVARLWSEEARDFEELLGITRKAMAAASHSGGAAYSVLAPMAEPPGAPIATLFAESLTPLRFHRFDAHIAAWRAAGLTVEQVQALGDGPAKDAIEADTNVRAALPYAALSEDERETLLVALRALPIVAA